MPYESLRVPHGAASLHVRLAGEGPALVLLPGMGRPSSDLDPLAERLAAGGYRVVLPETRGIGESTGPLEGLTLHDFAGDVAAVMEAVGIRDGVIVGHAFGNRIARAVAARRPELVRLVVLLGCSGLVQPEPPIAEAITLAQAVDTPPDIRAEAVKAAWYGPGRDISVWMSGWSQPVIQASLAAAKATPMEEWWTAGEARVLIMQGLADVSAPPANGRLLKEQIGPRATLVELEGVGHSLPVEAPDAVADTLLAQLPLLKA